MVQGTKVKCKLCGCDEDMAFEYKNEGLCKECIDALWFLLEALKKRGFKGEKKKVA